jgi:hypothetical protein
LEVVVVMVVVVVVGILGDEGWRLRDLHCDTVQQTL